jgi:purine-nucleoside phosphorylase
MKSMPLLVALFLCLSLSASAQISLLGKWKIAIPTAEGDIIEAVLHISDERNYTVDFGNDGTTDVTGKYEVQGDQITVWDTSGEMACPAEAKGVYSFVVTSESLTMNRITDACPGRAGNDGKMSFSKM